MRLVIAIALVLLLAGWTGCQRRPNVPEQVTVTVTELVPVPDWATEPLPRPALADGTVQSRLRRDDARGAVLELADCHRRLLRKLNAGEPVDAKACER